jgi:hypothetical protein
MGSGEGQDADVMWECVGYCVFSANKQQLLNRRDSAGNSTNPALTS